MNKILIDSSEVKNTVLLQKINVKNNKNENLNGNFDNFENRHNRNINDNIKNFSLSTINPKELNKNRNNSYLIRKSKFRDISTEKINDKSYAWTFKTLNNKENNINKNNNIRNHKDSIKFNKRRLEKSPDIINLFLKERKSYLQEDKINKNNITVNLKEVNTLKNNNIIDSNNEDNIKNNNKINIMKIRKQNDIKGNKTYHKSLYHNRKKKSIEILEYDGDMETNSFRQKYYSVSKIKNNLNKNRQNTSSKNKRGKEIISYNLKQINKNENDDEIYKYNEIIEPISIKTLNKNNTYNTFCEGFFVSGIQTPIKETSIIEDSVNFCSTCGHKFCSLLLSIRPEILHYFINDNFEIYDDLLQSISSLSFPLGVKLCIEGSFDTKDILQMPQKIFFGVIENRKGVKFYTCTKYYFVKVKSDEFKNYYKFDISSFFLKIKDNNNNDFKKYMKIQSQLINGNTFFVPQSITLLSKEPFLNSMSTCLNGFLASLLEEREILINHIINEVPTPEKNSQIKFLLSPYFGQVILNNEMNIYKMMSINNKKKQKVLYFNYCFSKEQLNYRILFEYISIENIIFIFQMILLEQRILLIYNDYEILSEIIFIFISLIYPFSWENNHIFPIISLDKIKLLQTIKPFIAGMDEYLFSYTKKNAENNIYFENDIIIYNISQKCFINWKNRKKIKKKDLLHEYKLHSLPEQITNFLIKELKLITKKINEEENIIYKNSINYDFKFYSKLSLFKQNLEYLTKLAFIKTLLILIGDYNNYTFYIEGEKPLFNKDSFIEAHKDKEFKYFLNQFINISLFHQFLENEKKIFFRDKTEGCSNQHNLITNKYYDTSYFTKISSKFSVLINNYQIRNNKNGLSNIINSNIYLKAKILSNQMTLIHNTNNININNNFNEVKKESLRSNKSENSKINKGKADILFPGKDYLEDNGIKNINNHMEYSNINKNGNIENYSIHIKKNNTLNPKELKLSPEAFTFIIPNKGGKEENFGNQKIIYINIDSYRKLSSYESNKEKNNFIKKYILTPYFLKSKVDGEDEENYIKEKMTEERIKNEIMMYKKKKNITEKIPPFVTPITIISKYIDYNSYNIKKTKIYIIDDNNNINGITDNKNNNNDQCLKQNILLDKEIISFKNKYFREEISEEVIDLSNIYGKDEETILINRCFKSCFINKPEINNQHLISLKKIFTNYENREYFANLIMPNIILKRKDNHKQLTISSFNIFSKIVKLSFENLNIYDYNIGRLLTLACFVYYKIEKNSKKIYIYNDFIDNTENMQKNSKLYELWNTQSFWIEFFILEFEYNKKEANEDDEEIYEEENNDDNKKGINNINIIKNENEDFDTKIKMSIIKTIIEISEIMFKLKLEKNFVVNIIENNILPIFTNDIQHINRIVKLSLIANNIN